MKRIFKKLLGFAIILGLAAGFSQDVRTSYADEISSGKSAGNTLIIRARDCAAVYNGMIQGEGDTTYGDPAEIAKKVEVEGLRSGDQLVKIDLFSQGQEPADYPIYVSGAGISYGAGNPTDSYDIIYQDGVFSIKKKKLIVTTGSASRKYDGKPLTNSDASLKGLVNGETASVKATGSRTDAGSSDNTYSIDWETADSNCYNLVEKLGRLVVDPQEATIAADSASKNFGDPDPVFTGTVEGLLKEGDLGEVKFVRKGDDEAPGTYKGVLTASYENNGNYRVSVKNGDFTIRGFTVTFGANGGSGSMKAAADVAGDYKLPACLFTAPDGRMFDCWQVDGKEYAAGDTITVTGDITVTAKWKKTDPGHVHDLSLVEAEEATCTEEGNEAYYICSGCDLWFEDATALAEIKDKSSVILKALGHKWDKGTVTKEPTETEEGIRTYTCKNDSSHTKEETIPPIGHKHILTKTDAVSATCTEAGNTAYYVCDGCGLWFKDAEAETQITDKSSVILKALGHRWDSGTVTKEATTEEKGIRTYTCLNDSSHKKTEEIPKKEKKPSGDSGRDHTSFAVTGRWMEDAAGWHYLESNRMVTGAWRYLGYNGRTCWYFFDEGGTMMTGWLDWKGERYYLYPVSDGWKGRMLTGWQLIDGKWYYFEPARGSSQGRMYRGERTPDGFYVGSDGVWDGRPANTGM